MKQLTEAVTCSGVSGEKQSMQSVRQLSEVVAADGCSKYFAGPHLHDALSSHSNAARDSRVMGIHLSPWVYISYISYLKHEQFSNRQHTRGASRSAQGLTWSGATAQTQVIQRHAHDATVLQQSSFCN